jgi:hypothetical protein
MGTASITSLRILPLEIQIETPPSHENSTLKNSNTLSSLAFSNQSREIVRKGVPLIDMGLHMKQEPSFAFLDQTGHTGKELHALVLKEFEILIRVNTTFFECTIELRQRLFGSIFGLILKIFSIDLLKISCNFLSLLKNITVNDSPLFAFLLLTVPSDRQNAIILAKSLLTSPAVSRSRISKGFFVIYVYIHSSIYKFISHTLRYLTRIAVASGGISQNWRAHL